MSILSAQCERLRSLANNLRQTSRGHKEYISAMRDVADTIWKLRNTNLDMANENDDLKAENAKLRVQRDEWRRVAEAKQDIIDHMRDARSDNARLRKLAGDLYSYFHGVVMDNWSYTSDVFDDFARRLRDLEVEAR